MMKSICMLAAALLLWAPAAPAQAGDWTGNINFFIGMKALDQNDWAPTDDQLAFGAKADFRPRDWPFNFAVDIIHSRDDDTMVIFDPAFGNIPFRMEASTTEFNLGVRKYWESYEMMRPFIGGGLAVIKADVTGTALGISVTDDDSAIGLWVGGGLLWVVEDCINIGADFGYSIAETTLFDVDVEAGGFHVGALVGFHF